MKSNFNKFMLLISILLVLGNSFYCLFLVEFSFWKTFLWWFLSTSILFVYIGVIMIEVDVSQLVIIKTDIKEMRKKVKTITEVLIKYNKTLTELLGLKYNEEEEIKADDLSRN